MHDWFYSTLAAGVLFIASLELMLIGFCYVFFFLDLEGEHQAAPANRTVTNRTQTNKTAVARANAGRNTIVTRSPGASRASGAGGAASGASSEGSRVRVLDAAAEGGAGSTFSDGGTTTSTRVYGDGLRRRLGVSNDSDGRREEGGVVESDYNRRPFSLSSTPPGVRAYQRGARHSHAVGGSRAVCTSAPDSVVGISARGRGPSSSGSDSSLQQASREELDAAAMASWAALGGNADQEVGPRAPVGLAERGFDTAESATVVGEAAGGPGAVSGATVVEDTDNGVEH